MKSTEKFVEIMEKLTGVSVGSKVTFKENSYEVAGINTEDLTALVALKCEGQEDIEINLKDLVESEEYVIEKKCKEEMDDEEDDSKKDDEEDDSKKKGDDEEEMKEEEEEEDPEKDDGEEEEDDKEMEEKKKKAKK